ncbi:GNAT family N-acetyltransferase [Acetobacter sp. TBRC 12305]|uniref:GNAT family N-acetyltransferase n=1 Tax=Acetobacter garciniae TaxID=2817435 RepID=A0A939KPH6_9PROT|nr:GNAT family N-acetyltransferase [Acetobacter garciniae]MBO1323964.1 GNAT family N-acetyltransferase [Acetobacter garciniae]MBX0343653.1 GNAT family N-acetyltransferase [Acetobacter garciniae]
MTTESALHEAVTRMKVTITFMRMTAPPPAPRLLLPPGWMLEHDVRPSVAQYRALHEGVGRSCCWWMRQAQPDRVLAALLATAPIGIGLLRENGALRGFYELDYTDPQAINLSYFGLLSQAIGRGVGRAFLDSVLRWAWRRHPRTVRVNTCTADHPRALPLYRAAGFTPLREVDEIWDVPDRLGLDIPRHLRV